MSYKCQKCGVNQPPRTPQHKVVTETHTVERVVDGELVRGSDISKEIVVCPPCHKELTPTPDPNKVILKPSDLRKIERASRKRLNRDEEDDEDFDVERY